VNKTAIHTDQEILTLLGASKTENKGFELLMINYQERLYWHIRRMVLDHEDANDVLQNTFIKESESNEEQMAKLKADPFFEASEVQEKLLLAILSLPEKQKAVFQLRYYNEMSYQDMSEVLETSVGALKASYHHAVKKIESFFNERN